MGSDQLSTVAGVDKRGSPDSACLWVFPLHACVSAAAVVEYSPSGVVRAQYFDLLWMSFAGHHCGVSSFGEPLCHGLFTVYGITVVITITSATVHQERAMISAVFMFMVSSWGGVLRLVYRSRQVRCYAGDQPVSVRT
jgi:hypothetical protein